MNIAVREAKQVCLIHNLKKGRNVLQHEKYHQDVNKIISVSERSDQLAWPSQWWGGPAQATKNSFISSISFPLPPCTHWVFIMLVPSDSALDSSVFLRFFLAYFLPHFVFFPSFVDFALHTFSLHFSVCGLTSWVERITCLSLLLPVRGFCFAVA